MSSQRAREAAEKLFKDCLSPVSLHAEWGTPGTREAAIRTMVEAFARLEVEALERGANAMQGAAAKVAGHHANARHKAKDEARKRNAKVEARDYESMAIEGVQIECAILALDTATVVKGLTDADT